MSQSTPEAPAAPPRKATLFCPRCGHHGPVPEDWTPLGVASEERYACPQCSEVIGRRLGQTEGERAFEAVDPLAAWGQATWKTWQAGLRTWWGCWAPGRSGAE